MAMVVAILVHSAFSVCHRHRMSPESGLVVPFELLSFAELDWLKKPVFRWWLASYFRLVLRLNTHTRNIVIGTDDISQESISNLPCKNRGTLSLELCNLSNDIICRNTRLGSSDSFGSNWSSLVVSSEYLGDATIADLKNPWDVTWTSSLMSQFYNFLSRRVRQRTSIDINASQLIDSWVTCIWLVTDIRRCWPRTWVMLNDILTLVRHPVNVLKGSEAGCSEGRRRDGRS